MRRQQYEDSLLTQINEPKYSSAPFRFFLNSASGLNRRRMETINRLLRIVLRSGLALLKRLIEAEVIGSEYPAEVRAR